MGIRLFARSFEKTSQNYEQNKINEFDPNPLIFEILLHCTINNNTVILITYPNCNTFEGKKIILFRNTTFNQIKKLKEIDPHFTETDKIKPFARFEPTNDGWNYACLLAQTLQNK